MKTKKNCRENSLNFGNTEEMNSNRDYCSQSIHKNVILGRKFRFQKNSMLYSRKSKQSKDNFSFNSVNEPEHQKKCFNNTENLNHSAWYFDRKFDHFLNQNKIYYPSSAMQDHQKESECNAKDTKDSPIEIFNAVVQFAHQDLEPGLLLEFNDCLKELEKSISKVHEFIEKIKNSTANHTFLIEMVILKIRNLSLKILSKNDELLSSPTKTENYYKSIFHLRNQTSFYSNKTPHEILEKDEIEAAKSLTQLSFEFRSSNDDYKSK